MDQEVLESDLCAPSVSGGLRSPPDGGSRGIHLLKSSPILGNNKGKSFLNKSKDRGLIPTAGTQSQSSKTHRNLYEGKIEKMEKVGYIQPAAIPRLIGFPKKNSLCPQITWEGEDFEQWQ